MKPHDCAGLNDALYPDTELKALIDRMRAQEQKRFGLKFDDGSEAA